MVPWDAGCDGPICSSMISSEGSAGTILSFQRAGSAMIFLVSHVAARPANRINNRIDFGNDRLALVIEVVLAQRMSFERIVHQDAPQVRMALEDDPEHVEAFALEPVRRAPHSNHAVDPGLGPVHCNLDADAMTAG